MEIAVDEWLIDCLSPVSSSMNVELVHAFTKTIKIRSDKIIFTSEHLQNIERKLKRLKREVQDTFYVPMVLHPLSEMLRDSEKAECRTGFFVQELSAIKDDDIAVVQSVLAIAGDDKLLVTTDQPLKEVLSDAFQSYGIRCIDPNQYLQL